MRPFTRSNPLLPLKQFRIYLSSRWSLSRRRKVIQDTYQLAIEKGGALEEALLSDMGIRLASIDLHQSAAEIWLRKDQRFRKEGELVISLDCEPLGGRIMSISLAAERHSREHVTVYIGCVQGEADGASAIRELTKAMHGLRPKALMILLAQEFSRAIGARELLGAGNDIQAHGQKHLIHLKSWHKLNFDYDGYWADAGGVKGFDGWHRLPLIAARRGLSDIKPNKRQMYVRRYSMLDVLSAQIQESLNTW